MSKSIHIVATNFMLRYFRKISIFKLELGHSLKQLSTKPGEAPTIKVRDSFVKQYEKINNGIFIHKYGSIGTIVFYEDSTLPRYEFHIYKDDQIYEIDANEDELKKTAQEYLTEIIKSISEDPHKVDEDSGLVKDVIYTNMPVEMSAPDIKLPKDQYIDALINRRKLSEKIKKQNGITR